MSYFEKVAARTPLDRHRVLSRTAGVRVSPLCLGGASLGDAWSKAGGAMGNGADEAASFALLDAYFAQGGNFIDMANNYQDGESERILGAWMRARGNRDELVVSSKYTSTFKFQQGPAAGVHISANFNGNAKKSLRLSLDHTLASLGTDYVDILYVHWWDWTTSVEEMMQALNREVQAGRVLYLGASDMPAWVVSSANAYARAHALAPFSVYEGLWSILQRDLERDIVPMCRAEGMAICPWGAVGRGKLRTEAEIEERIRTRGPLRGGAPQTDLEKRVSAGLDEMVKTDFDDKISITQLALGGFFFPLLSFYIG